jgi:hypothetical protein
MSLLVLDDPNSGGQLKVYVPVGVFQFELHICVVTGIVSLAVSSQMDIPFP